ncbi:MAG: GGDEF domain-containing protein, partial [Spirochaetales bacterium]|nr:GGDEF domain-containing protein [Candidatus Physcosoma equi]
LNTQGEGSMNIFKTFHQKLEEVAFDEGRLRAFLSNWTYKILGAVALLMSFINLITGKYLLMASTLAFALLSLLNVLIARKQPETASRIFAVEAMALFTFFLISGEPEGFSAIWICLLPTLGLLLFGRKTGFIASLSMFFLLILFLWTPLKVILQYSYTQSFCLRFPVLYLSFFALGLLLEENRSLAYQYLLKERENLEELTTHDAQTGTLNEIGLQKVINRLDDEGNKEAAFLIIDIDNMRAINAEFGHYGGDVVLCQLANITTDFFSKYGYVSRWEGCSFSVCLPGVDDWEGLADVYRNLIAKEELIINGQSWSITVSVGGYYGTVGKLDDYREIQREADTNLYYAKKNGGNTIYFSYPKYTYTE